MSPAAYGARSVRLGSICMPHDLPQHDHGADQNDCGGAELEIVAEYAVFGERVDGGCEQHEDHGGCRVPLDGFFESFTKIEEV